MRRRRERRVLEHRDLGELDRRHVIRRLEELREEIIKATPDRATRIERMAANLAERLTRTGDGEQFDPWQV